MVTTVNLRYLDMPNLDPLDSEGGTNLWKSSQLLLSYCYSCYSSHSYFDILGFPFQQSHSSQCAKETPTSIFWAKPREKQVLLRCLGFGSRAEKTNTRKVENPENLLWHPMTRLMTRWCDTVWISMNLPQDSTDSYVEFVLTTALSWGLGIFSEFSFGVPSCNVFRSPVEWKQHGICLAEKICQID